MTGSEVDIEEFEAQILAHGGADIVVAYADVARVFSSNQPHPDSFDYKSIDQRALLVWAEANHWEVHKLTDQVNTDFPNSPPIRFTKVER